MAMPPAHPKRLGHIVTFADAMRPRYGFKPDAWRRIVALGMAYQMGGYDWGGEPEPDPREQIPHLCFARWLYRKGRISG